MIIVDGDDHRALLHACDVLDLTGDTTGNVEFGSHGDTCLADLAVVLGEAGIDCRT